MSMRCPACGLELVSDLGQCPNCGFDLEHSKTNHSGSGSGDRAQPIPPFASGDASRTGDSGVPPPFTSADSVQDGNDAPVHSGPLSVGMHVFARWHDDFWYPGVIDKQEGRLFHVAFDDGDEAWLEPHNISTALEAPGEAANYLEGSIASARGRDGKWHRVRLIWRYGRLWRVRFEDGVEAVMDTSRIRPPDGTQYESSQSAGTKANGGQYLEPQVGQRVYAKWSNGLWYPGVIDDRNGDRFHVSFDDGDRAWVKKEEISTGDETSFDPKGFQAGDSVTARWTDGGWYKATLLSRHGRLWKIRYYDGVEAVVDPSWLRSDGKRPEGKLWGCLNRAAWIGGLLLLFVVVPFVICSDQGGCSEDDDEYYEEIEPEIFPYLGDVKVGARVLAPYQAQLYFVGTIQGVQPGGKVQIRFLDGDQAVVERGSLLEENIGPGMPVDAYLDQYSRWYHGIVQSRQGDRVLIHFDDDDRETVNLQKVRIQVSRVPPPVMPLDGPPRPGTKVLAPYGNPNIYYIGNIAKVLANNRVQVDFVDGDTAVTEYWNLLRDNLAPGMFVEAYYDSNRSWYNAVIRRRDEDQITVEYSDDGVTQTVGLDHVRLNIAP